MADAGQSTASTGFPEQAVGFSTILRIFPLINL
jgi:hypothetical protein